MNLKLKWTGLGLLATLALTSVSSWASNYKGQTCRSTDTDPIKCLVCVQAWEANNSRYEDMQRVVGVVKTRLNSSKYPNNICKIVYQRGQFVGLRHGKVLNKPDTVLAQMVKAARNTGANGYLGFRAGRGGNNRLRRSGALTTPIAPAPVENYEQTAFLEEEGAATATN